jgi:UDP-N-acetyl-2-amino-2-deoxyglucuronate dehydrogenase
MYKFAIIGCGRIAHRHAQNIIRVGQLAAVCDTNEAKADEFAAKYNSKAWYAIDELLLHAKEIDIIVVCTPNGLHAEHSIKSLQGGRDVLCEKPLCLTSAAAWQMINIEKFSRKKLFVVKSARFNSLLKSLKLLIETKKLGALYSFQLSCFWSRPKEYYHDWHGKLFPDGGTLYTQFSHYIDALLWIFGEIDSTTGYRENKAHKDVIEFEDTGCVALKMKNNLLGTINWSVNSYQKNSEISLTLIAENGTVSIGGEYLNEIKYTQLPAGLNLEQQEKNSNEYGSYKGSMSHHAEIYDNLMEQLSNPTSPSNSFDGLMTVEAIEKIYKSVPLT